MSRRLWDQRGLIRRPPFASPAAACSDTQGPAVQAPSTLTRSRPLPEVRLAPLRLTLLHDRGLGARGDRGRTGIDPT